MLCGAASQPAPEQQHMLAICAEQQTMSIATPQEQHARDAEQRGDHGQQPRMLCQHMTTATWRPWAERRTENGGSPTASAVHHGVPDRKRDAWRGQRALSMGCS